MDYTIGTIGPNNITTNKKHCSTCNLPIFAQKILSSKIDQQSIQLHHKQIIKLSTNIDVVFPTQNHIYTLSYIYLNVIKMHTKIDGYKLLNSININSTQILMHMYHHMTYT